MTDVRVDVGDIGPVPGAQEDPVRGAVAVTTSLIGLVRGFAAVLAVPAAATMPRSGSTLLAVCLPMVTAAILVKGGETLTSTPVRRVLLVVGDLGAGVLVLAVAGFGVPCAFQSLGTAALVAALYGVPGVLLGAALGMLAAVLAVLSPAFGSTGDLPLGIVVSIPTAYALAALMAALVRHLQADQLALRMSLRRATWSAAQAQERARLARDLHDSLAKTLAGIGLIARAAQRDPAHGTELAGEIATAAEEATGQARTMIAGLRSVPAGALADTVLDTVARSGLSGVRTELDPVREPDAVVRAELLAVLSEALVNVQRHAGATTVLVGLSERDGALRLTVRDDGAGFVVPSSFAGLGRYGLLGMTERLQGIGGGLSISSAPGAGTTVVAEVSTTAALSPHRLITAP